MLLKILFSFQFFLFISFLWIFIRVVLSSAFGIEIGVVVAITITIVCLSSFWSFSMFHIRIYATLDATNTCKFSMYSMYAFHCTKIRTVNKQINLIDSNESQHKNGKQNMFKAYFITHNTFMHILRAIFVNAHGRTWTNPKIQYHVHHFW